MERSYSRLTKKGQVTIPASMRRKYGLEQGKSVSFHESTEGLILKPLPDIIDAAGTLASHADVKEVLKDVLKARGEDFR